MFKSAKDILGQGHRSMVLLGSPKTGKTTFVCSGSQNAPDTVDTQGEIDASDVLLIQRDAEGHLGPVDLHYNPSVADLSGIDGWQTLNSALAKTIHAAVPLAKEGKIRVVGIDLSTIANDVVVAAAGASFTMKDKLSSADISLAGKDVDWNRVGAEGLVLYRALRSLPCLVVAMCHMKLVHNNPMAAKEHADVQLKREATAVGGETGRLMADVAKGLMAPWLANSSFIFARERDTSVIGGKRVSKFETLTAPDGIYQIGSRRESVLPPRTSLSLRKLMELAYSK